MIVTVHGETIVDILSSCKRVEGWSRLKEVLYCKKIECDCRSEVHFVSLTLSWRTWAVLIVQMLHS